MMSPNPGLCILFKDSYLTVVRNWRDWIKVISGPWLVLLGIALCVFVSQALRTSYVNFDTPFLIKLQRVLESQLFDFTLGLLGCLALMFLAIRIIQYALDGKIPETWYAIEWKANYWFFIPFGLLLAILPFVTNPYNIYELLSYGKFWLHPYEAMFRIFGSTFSEIYILFLTGLDSTATVISVGISLALLAFVPRTLFFMQAVIAQKPNPVKESWDVSGKFGWFKCILLVIILGLPLTLTSNFLQWGFTIILKEMILDDPSLQLTLMMGYFIMVDTLIINTLFAIIIFSALTCIYKAATPPREK